MSNIGNYYSKVLDDFSKPIFGKISNKRKVNVKQKKKTRKKNKTSRISRQKNRV